MLKDLEYFKKVKGDGHTIVWPNEVDFCPDLLYKIGENVRKKPIHKRKNVNLSTSEKPRTRVAAKSKYENTSEI